MLYEYIAEVTKVTDGDTVKLRVDCGFGIHKDIVVRMLGYDAHEINVADPKEKQLGLDAKHLLESMIANKMVWVRTHKDKTDKYGRYLAEMKVDREDGLLEDVNQSMKDSGLVTIS